jgi:hypothetical protein
VELHDDNKSANEAAGKAMQGESKWRGKAEDGEDRGGDQLKSTYFV